MPMDLRRDAAFERDVLAIVAVAADVIAMNASFPSCYYLLSSLSFDSDSSFDIFNEYSSTFVKMLCINIILPSA